MISFDVERMTRIHDQLGDLLLILQENMLRIERIVNGLDGNWKGEAGRTFAEKILSFQGHYRQLEHQLERYMEELWEYSEMHRQHEADIRRRLERII